MISGQSLSAYGIYPRELSGLRGILLSPLLHGSFSHLLNNSFPLLVLGSALFFFYRDLAPRIFFLGLLITGIWVWAIARQSFHIGASGVVYSLAAFLFVSGIIRRHPRLMALSLLVAFLYGSMIWGIFPIREHISWESHLMGMLSGVLLALFYRGTGPQRPLYSWELEEEEDLPDWFPSGESSLPRRDSPGPAPVQVREEAPGHSSHEDKEEVRKLGNTHESQGEKKGQEEQEGQGEGRQIIYHYRSASSEKKDKAQGHDGHSGA